MTKTLKVALAGAGAFGIKHLDGIKNIDGVEVVSLVGRELEKTQAVARQYGITHMHRAVPQPQRQQRSRQTHARHAGMQANVAAYQAQQRPGACRVRVSGLRL